MSIPLIKYSALLVLLTSLAACGGGGSEPDEPDAGGPVPTIVDTDGDSIADAVDNCPAAANASQADADGDGSGDACDAITPPDAPADNDGDGVADTIDNCPTTANADQRDTDNDGLGDACDDATVVPPPPPADSDGDGIADANDNCPRTANADQLDSDGNGTGDACDVRNPPADADSDGVADGSDNCPSTANADQRDTDGDGAGDACDATAPDRDGDGIADASDNCPADANASQLDSDADGIGDACDAPAPAPDTDGDGVANDRDNCPTTANADQLDTDANGVGDACQGPPVAARCPLPAGAQTLHEWTGTAETALLGTTLSGGPAVETYELPAGCEVRDVTVDIQWATPLEDLDLAVSFPGGGQATSADFQLSGEAVERVGVARVGAGTFSMTVTGYISVATAFNGRITGIVGDAGSGGGGGDTGLGPIRDPQSEPGRPRVVVADMDSGINPYHAIYYGGSELYPDAHPSSVTQEVLAELGVKPENVVQLTRTGNLAADLAADKAFWDRVERGVPYHFKGTNIVAISFAADGDIVLKPDVSKSAHGVGTSHAVLRANPEAVMLFVEQATDLGSDRSHEYSFGHPAVDIVTTSYGVSIPQTGFPLPETRAFHMTYEGVILNGKLHFSSGGNGPGLTPLRAGAGPWWSIGVSGIEEGTSEGRSLLSGNFPDFISDFTQDLAYCMDCQSGMQSVGGTSFSTPRAAGVASRVLLDSRRALGHTGGIKTVDGKPVMAASAAGRTISNWFLRRALEQGAYAPDFSEYDPTQAVTDLVGLPINPVAPWLQTGWGDLSALNDKGVVAAALSHLGLAKTPREKALGFCEFQTELILERKRYWDQFAPLLPDVLGGDQTGTVPAQDPFLYCASSVPGHPETNDPAIVGEPGDGGGDPEPLPCPAAGQSAMVATFSGTAGTAVGGLGPVGTETRHSVTVPASCSLASLTVRIEWANAAEDLDLQVLAPDGSVAGTSEQTNLAAGAFEQVVVANPVAGTYTAVVRSFTNIQTAYDGSGQTTGATAGGGGGGGGGGDEPPAETACAAAFESVAVGADVARIDPGLRYGLPGSLIFTFADSRGRDEGLKRLLQGGLLSADEAARTYALKRLNMVRVPVALVTGSLVSKLRRAMQGLPLISIWGDHARVPSLDSSVPLIGVNAARQAFASPSLPLTGQGIGVAIIDTGIDTFQGDLKAVQHNVRMVGNVAVPLANTEVVNGHGTHLAGTIAGDGTMSEGRFVGVAPGATLVGVAVEVGAPYLFTIEAMDYVLQMQQTYNIRVTNHSYGPGTGSGFRFDPSSPDSQAVKALHDAGIVPVFAAGNLGPNDDTISDEAQNPCAIGVAAGDRAFQLADFSSRGTANGDAVGPDITAPGVNITASRAVNGINSTPTPRLDYPAYATISGTSMAAPHVAGVVALLLEARPDLSFEQIHEVLTTTADPMTRPDGSAYQPHEVGAGYVDALEAIARVLDRDVPVTDVPGPVIPGAGRTPVASFANNGGTLTTPVFCLGCGSDPEFGFHRYTYELAAKPGVDALEVALTPSTPSALFNIDVLGPDGATVGSDTTPGVDGGLLVTVAEPKAGTYTVLVQELVGVGGTPYSVAITTVCPADGCDAVNPPPPVTDTDGDGRDDAVDNCPAVANFDQADADADGIGDACETPTGGDAPVAGDDAQPRVVVAVIDSGINPYHAFYNAGSPIYPAGSAPSSVTRDVLAEFAVKPECELKLTRTGNFEADFATDTSSGLWARAASCDVMWFVGTNVLAKSFIAGTRVVLPDNADDTHGVGVSAAVLKANPEAVLLFLEGISDASEEYAMTHAAIDLVSTSYGAVGSLPIPEHINRSFTGTQTFGKLHFGACDNSPATAPQDGTCGPWWSIGIAGYEEGDSNYNTGEPQDASNGKQLISGSLPDFLADFTQVLPYCDACEDGYDDFVAGTSFATPRSAGTTSKILLELRRKAGHLRGIRLPPQSTAPLMVSSGGIAVSNWQLRRVLEVAAWYPPIENYDPVQAVFDQVAVPIPPAAPYTVAGWGVLSTDQGGVVDEALSLLGVRTRPPGEVPRTKSVDTCYFQTALITLRKGYWDFVAVGSETFLNPPQPDPFLFCE